MPIPAGKLCHRIAIEQRSTKTEASGQVVTSEWTPIHRSALPASYLPVSGGETIRNRQVVATATALFEVRYLPQLLESNAEQLRLRWITGHANPVLAPVMEVLKVEDADGLRESITVQAKRTKQ